MNLVGFINTIEFKNTHTNLLGLVLNLLGGGIGLLLLLLGTTTKTKYQM